MRIVGAVGVLIVVMTTLLACSPERGEMDQVSLSGVVRNGGGKPIPNCLVTSTNRPEENAIMTDASGGFESSAYSGKQTITATCPDANLKGELSVDVPTSGKNYIQITVS